MTHKCFALGMFPTNGLEGMYYALDIEDDVYTF